VAVGEFVIGSETFILMSAQPGTADRKNIAATEYVSTTLPGCLSQPVDVSEDESNVDYALATYMITSEPFPAALGAKTDDLLQNATPGALVFGMQYRVIGAKVYPGPNGMPHHVVMYATVPSGLNG
jgi:hypothetical protein